MTDDIDLSEVLPYGVPRVNAHRAAKGDLRIEDVSHRVTDSIKHAHYITAKGKTLMMHLHDEGHLTAQHIDDGETFQIWQLIARSLSGYRNNPIYRGKLEQEFGRLSSSMTDQDASHGEYTQVIHAIGYHAKTVERALNTPATEHELFNLRTLPYRIAFDALSKTMERLRERRKAAENSSVQEINI